MSLQICSGTMEGKVPLPCTAPVQQPFAGIVGKSMKYILSEKLRCVEGVTNVEEVTVPIGNDTEHCKYSVTVRLRNGFDPNTAGDKFVRDISVCFPGCDCTFFRSALNNQGGWVAIIEIMCSSLQNV